MSRRNQFTFTKGMCDAIRSADLSDRDLAGLFRAMMSHAFGGAKDSETGQLTKVTRPMSMLIGAMIDSADGCQCGLSDVGMDYAPEEAYEEAVEPSEIMVQHEPVPAL